MCAGARALLSDVAAPGMHVLCVRHADRSKPELEVSAWRDGLRPAAQPTLAAAGSRDTMQSQALRVDRTRSEMSVAVRITMEAGAPLPPCMMIFARING